MRHDPKALELETSKEKNNKKIIIKNTINPNVGYG